MASNKRGAIKKVMFRAPVLLEQSTSDGWSKMSSGLVAKFAEDGLGVEFATSQGTQLVPWENIAYVTHD